MGYEAMSGSELQQECARRGLPSSRAAKAAMMQRLLDDDAEREAPNGQPKEDSDAPVPPPAETAADSSPSEQTGRPQAEETVRVFTKAFPAEPDGPDEETHLAYRQATLAAADDAGYQTRGDARLAAVRDGDWLYEVSVRQVT